MKKLLFIHGPNGVGKSTLCKNLNRKLPNSAWLESEWCRMTNPFTFSPDTIMLSEKNMTYLLRNYLECDILEYVIFNYGLHGPRKQIVEKVFQNLSDLRFQFIPILITCSETENIERMKADGRDEELIKRSLTARNIYAQITDTPRIDTTFLSVDDAANKVLGMLG